MTSCPPQVLLAAVVALGLGQAGCAVCDQTGDCPSSDVCVEGACVSAPAATATVLLPTGPVGETFDVALELRFRGGEALVSLERSVDAPGEPCLPLPPISRRVPGDVDDFVTRVVVLSGVPSLGSRFTLNARIEVNGRTIYVRVPVEGPPPPPSLGGITLLRPTRADVDVVAEPRLDVEVEAPGVVRAWMEPVGLAALSTPALVLTPQGGGRHLGRVPSLRGPHLLWVESSDGDSTRLCGHGLLGGPPEVGDNELEVLLLSESVDDTNDHLVQLSTRVTDGGIETFCDGRLESAVPCRLRLPTAIGPQGADAVVIGLDRGLVEIAAVPRLTSGPVTVQVRVSRGEQHLAWFGPLTLQPALGEVWLAGRVVVDDEGSATATPATSPPLPGLPW